ncbi:MAG: lipid-A-disaccharide synthase [Myxococcales bacterium]|nr:lipid-A-disaccharide synthase [Myxococcales bacterium]
MSRRPLLWIAAGEASGDRLGAALITELTERLPDLRVRGLLGPRMRATGAEQVAAAESATAMGLVEVLGAIPRLARLLGRLEADLAAERPDVVVTIDSPELLLRLAARAKRRGLATVHWVCPQLWAWRPARARRLGRQVDVLLCLLPFEPAWIPPPARAVFVGHPAAAVRAEPGTGSGRRIVALCPGSRPSEVARHWPVLREVARRLRERWASCDFVVPAAPTVDRGSLTGVDARIVPSLAQCAEACVAVVASGTATLELAALRVPMVVIYRVHPLTWPLARALVRVRHVALPNVLAGRQVVPEVLQDLDPDVIADHARRVAGQREQVPSDVLASLHGGAAVARAVDEVQRVMRLRGPAGPPDVCAGS